MGNCNNKTTDETSNVLNIGSNVIEIFKKQDKYDYSINLNRAISIYDDEKQKNNNLDLEYTTKCLILACFIRDIDKILLDKKNKIFNDVDIKIILIKLKIPIFTIDLIQNYKYYTNKKFCIEYYNEYINKMTQFDNQEIYDNNFRSIEDKLNILISIINSIYII